MNDESSNNIKIIIGIIIALIALIVVLVLIKGCSKVYTVTFDTDGGSKIKSVKVKDGEKVDRPDDPTREGYIFDDWYLEDSIFDFDTKITKDITLIAYWKVDSIILDNNSLNLAVGDQEQIVISILPEGLEATDLIYESSDPSIATVSKTGVIKALKEGTVTITIKDKDGKYSTSIEVLITKEKVKIDSIEITGLNSVMVGKSIKLGIKIKPSNATSEKITWKSSDESIATVDSNGKVYGIKTGKVTITATTESGIKATKIITVTKKSESNGSGTSNKPSDSSETNPGETEKPSNPSGETSNPEENPSTPSKPEETLKEITGLEITGDNKVKVDSSINLTLTITPSDASDKTVTWKSSDESIATVDSNGKVIGITSGKVTITVTSSNGIKATHEITVEEYTYELELTKIPLEGLKDTTYQYYYKVLRDKVEFKDYKGFVLNNQEYRKVASNTSTIAGNDVLDNNSGTITLSNGKVKPLKVNIK